MRQAVKEKELKQFNEFEIIAYLYQRGLDSTRDCSGGIWSLAQALEGSALDSLVDVGAVQYNNTHKKIMLTELGIGMALSGAVEFDSSGKQIRAKCGSILNLALISIMEQDPERFMSYL